MDKSLLLPNEYYPYIADIDFAKVSPHTNIIIDVDNTLVERDVGVVAVATVDLLKKLKKEGLIKNICLVSNVVLPSHSRIRRITQIANQLDAFSIFAYGWHSKPHRQPFERAMQLMQSTPLTTAVIGDQLYTDIRGGNALGIYTIWVKPLGSDAWFTWYRRFLERKLQGQYRDNIT
jgi:HAD superfamily phosphatase (TIGR01668 family)